jgi:hypothetical protein
MASWSRLSLKAGTVYERDGSDAEIRRKLAVNCDIIGEPLFNSYASMTPQS